MAIRVAASVILFAVAFCLVSRSMAQDDKSVVHISGQTDFDKVIASSEFVLVEFYAPWCGHCKKLEPEFEAAAKELAKGETGIVLAAVDATDDKNAALASKYDVKGYPTLKIFRARDKSSPIDYNGPREKAGIVNTLSKQAGPATIELTNAEETAELAGKNDVLVIGLFDDLTSEPFSTFDAVAKNLREEVGFAHTSSPAAFMAAHEAMADSTAPSIVMVRTFDAPLVVYAGDTSDEEGLSAWITEKSIPLVTELDSSPKNRDVLRKLFASSLPKALLFADFAASDTKLIRAALAESAEAHAGKLLFVEGDATTNEGALKFFGLDSNTVPAVVVHDTEKDLKFKSEKVSAESLATWLTSFLAGEVEPHVKTEEIPEENNGPVITLVAKQFKELVEDSPVDAFIEFYAPWCGHCKKLAPIWEEVGEHFKNDKTVMIAKMDATANDVVSKEYNVKGFPTLYFKKADGKVIAYTGDRSKAPLIAFVEEHRVSKPHEEL